MKAEDYVRMNLPDVRIVARAGNFVGGKHRYEIMNGKKCIGMDTRKRSAWAEAMRWLKGDKP